MENISSKLPLENNENLSTLKKKISSVSNWYHRVEVAPGIFTPGINDSYDVLNNLDIPLDCSGLRILDLGARDGFFSIMLEKRNAKEVIALDHVPPEKTGFPVLKEIFNSKVKYINENIYDLSPEKYGEFDIVLCLGLLYHLRNPLLALDNIRRVCKRVLYVESFCIDNRFILPDKSSKNLSSISRQLLDIPIMEFYPTDELSSDPTNWWGPNSLCLKKMLESSSFNVISSKVDGDRVTFKCSISEDKFTLYYNKIEKGLVN
jgi:tRNA (mo5U34)-methyltransferase